MKKKILLIEDQYDHRRDARQYFADKPDVELIVAETYSKAAEVMIKWDDETYEDAKGDIDGIISDIYFPLASEGRFSRIDPIGVRVAVEATKLGIPFVLCTAGYHHGDKYEWIYGLACSQSWKLIDPEDHSDHETEAPKKDWDKAYRTLERML
jgi:hypothetical protein